jgi:hypothetical protein
LARWLQNDQRGGFYIPRPNLVGVN